MRRLITVIKEAIYNYDTQLRFSSCILERDIYYAITLLSR